MNYRFGNLHLQPLCPAPGLEGGTSRDLREMKGDSHGCWSLKHIWKLTLNNCSCKYVFSPLSQDHTYSITFSFIILLDKGKWEVRFVL